MTTSTKRVLIWAPILLLIVAGVAFALWPRPVSADLATVERGALRVAIEEEGVTRIREVYTVSAPVTGRLQRIALDVGDQVVGGETVIAELQPIDPGFLDVRTEAEMNAVVRAAEAATELASANVERAKARLEFAEADLERAERLAATETVSSRQRDEAKLAVETGRAELAQAEATLHMREHEHERAQMQLMSPLETFGQRDSCVCVPIMAPVTGKVLQILEESEAVVHSGTPLVEIGQPDDLEVVVDLLSADAVRVEPGFRVIIGDWGGEGALNGEVVRIEPFGFRKVSALGIEEQRVNVRIALTDPAEAYARLAHGFRVEAAVVLWEGDDVVKVPLTALFRRDGQSKLFVVRDGTVAEIAVEIGQSNGLEAEVVDGVAAGDVIILHPSDSIAEGVRVTARGGGI